jgi:hypothetical protein
MNVGAGSLKTEVEGLDCLTNCWQITDSLTDFHKQPTYFHCTSEFIEVSPTRELKWLLHYSFYET